MTRKGENLARMRRARETKQRPVVHGGEFVSGGAILF
jgi:hypothetical protein